MDQAWLVKGDQLSIVSCDEDIKLFSWDCYILKYTYSRSQRDESILYAWLGSEFSLYSGSLGNDSGG